MYTYRINILNNNNSLKTLTLSVLTCPLQGPGLNISHSIVMELYRVHVRVIKSRRDLHERHVVARDVAIVQIRGRAETQRVKVARDGAKGGGLGANETQTAQKG